MVSTKALQLRHFLTLSADPGPNATHTGSGSSIGTIRPGATRVRDRPLEIRLLARLSAASRSPGGTRCGRLGLTYFVARWQPPQVPHACGAQCQDGREGDRCRAPEQRWSQADQPGQRADRYLADGDRDEGADCVVGVDAGQPFGGHVLLQGDVPRHAELLDREAREHRRDQQYCQGR